MTPVWHKSRHSGSDPAKQNCVEVAQLCGEIGVRDSKAAEAPHLVLGRADWQEFTRRVKRGEHDLP